MKVGKPFTERPFLGRGYTVDINGFLWKKGRPLKPHKFPNSQNVWFYVEIDTKKYRISQKTLLEKQENATPEIMI